LAGQIVDSLTSDWKPDRYHDTYAEDLRSRIEAKDKGKEVVEEDRTEEPTADVVDLMSALEASVRKAKGARSTKGTRSSGGAGARRKARPRTTKARKSA
jgi:DNA end-binding protein Ku